MAKTVPWLDAVAQLRLGPLSFPVARIRSLEGTYPQPGDNAMLGQTTQEIPFTTWQLTIENLPQGQVELIRNAWKESGGGVLPVSWVDDLGEVRHGYVSQARLSFKYRNGQFASCRMAIEEVV